jgi:hypothetical protein
LLRRKNGESVADGVRLWTAENVAVGDMIDGHIVSEVRVLCGIFGDIEGFEVLI